MIVACVTILYSLAVTLAADVCKDSCHPIPGPPGRDGRDGPPGTFSYSELKQIKAEILKETEAVASKTVDERFEEKVKNSMNTDCPKDLGLNTTQQSHATISTNATLSLLLGDTGYRL